MMNSALPFPRNRKGGSSSGKAVFIFLIFAAAFLMRHIFCSGNSGFPLAAQEKPRIASVNLPELFPLHPFYPRLAELDKEIEKWRSGRPEWNLSSRKNHPPQWDRKWKAEVNRISRPFSPEEPQKSRLRRSPGEDSSFPALMRTSQQIYRRILREKEGMILEAARQERKTAREEVKKVIQAYASQLFFFRNRKISVEKAFLFQTLQKKLRYRAAAFQEEFLEFEKNLLQEDQEKKLSLQLKLAVAGKQEKEEIQAEYQALEESEKKKLEEESGRLQAMLQAYEESKRTEISGILNSLRVNLDREARRKIGMREEELKKAAAEAFREQEKSFALLSAEEKRKTPGNENPHAKESEDFPALQGLVQRGEKTLKARSDESRLQVEGALLERKKQLFSDTKAYEDTLRAIRKGNRALAFEVVQGLKEEREIVFTAIRSEILKQAEILAKEKGIPVVVSQPARNREAFDLTPEIARELKRQRVEL